MYNSESIIDDLLMEIDSLDNRLQNIKSTYCNTIHNRLRERLIYENQSIILRVKEIFSIAKTIDERTKENISFTKLLVEKCRRIIYKTEIETNLFFL